MHKKNIKTHKKQIKKDFLPLDGKKLENVPSVNLCMISNYTGIRHYFQSLQNKILQNYENNDKSLSGNSLNWEYQIPIILSNCKHKSDLIAEMRLAIEDLECLIQGYEDVLKYDTDETIEFED